MAQKMEAHRERYRSKYKNTKIANYIVGDLVLVFDPKLKAFFREGHIVSFEPPPSDSPGPRDYMIKFDEGNTRKVNTQWIIKLPTVDYE